METLNVDIASSIEAEEPLPSSLDVATNIWRFVTSKMGEVRQARGQDPEVEFDEYLNFLETITAAELSSFLTNEDEADDEIQRSTVQDWLDQMELTQLSAAVA